MIFIVLYRYYDLTIHVHVAKNNPYVVCKPQTFFYLRAINSFFMPPTLKKLREHIGLGLSVQSVSLSVMREHSVRNR